MIGSNLIKKCMDEARDIAEMYSEDPSTRVGCAIFKEQEALLALGYNQLAPGTPAIYWETKHLKYKHVVHAEVHALLQAGLKAQGALMFVTHHPCRECAMLIAMAGIDTVFCPEKAWRDEDMVLQTVAEAKEILLNAHVRMHYV